MQLLHTMLRVGDLQRSVDFYTKTIGMDLLRTTERPDQKYNLAFVGFGGGNKNGEAELELTYNYGVSDSGPRTATSPWESMTSPRPASGFGPPAATSPASRGPSRAGRRSLRSWRTRTGTRSN